jgi:uncharacterized OB-fold protein
MSDMASEGGAYPGAREDGDNRGFLEAWRAGKLAVQACGDCGRRFFYPRPLCPHCWSDKLRWETLPGDGEIVSFSLIHRPNHPSFFAEVPISLAEIRVAQGVTLLARIVDAPPGSLRSGGKVRLVAGEAAARYPLPTFRAVPR